MNIFSGGYNDYSNGFGINSFFSSGSNSNSGSGLGMDSLLTDYRSIKSGTYGKLLKAYYAKNPADTAKGLTSTTKGASADDTKQITELKNNSADVVKSASSLYSTSASSLFKAENKDDLYKAVSSFVDDYNKLVKAAGESNNNKVLRSGSSMVSNTASVSSLLGKAGITIQSDNTLKIDEDTFKKAESSTLKTLFSGTGSFAYKTGTSASFISMYANQDAAKNSGLYNQNAAYSGYNAGNLFNYMF